MLIGNATWGDFTCNSDIEMISDATKAIVGTTCLRTDVGALPGTLYELRALPNNVLDNWQPVVSGGVIATFTAAQLSAKATAGTLTPFAAYVPSDASPPYQLWARDAFTLSIGQNTIAPGDAKSLRRTPRAKGAILTDPKTGLIYGQSNGVGGYTALGIEAQQRLSARRLVNATGASANYIVAQRGPRKFGGYLVVSGTFNITIRHGIVVGGDILQYDASPTGDKRITPSDITDGLFVTLSADAEVVLFFSDDKDNQYAPFGSSSGPVAVPMAATGRFWLGRGLLRGFTITGQSAAGTGIKLYDGWDNAGYAIHINATPTVGRMGGAAEFLYPIELRSGGYVELLGTAQTITLDMGEAQ